MISYLEITSGLTHSQAESAVDNLMELMGKSLVKGERVMLNGIGVLAGKKVPPRLVAGFKKDYHIGERVKITFRSSKAFKEKLNDGSTIKTLKDLQKHLRKN